MNGLKKPAYTLLVLIFLLSIFSPLKINASETEKADSKIKNEEIKPLEIPTLKKIIVTASKKEKNVFDEPYSAEVLEKNEITKNKTLDKVAAIFEDDPTIMVQKTSGGQQSPFLRGFTGYRTLFLIDGIRLNNSVFRDGPNQYWNTVDPYMIEKLEIVKGPSSVLYGSDAIGGTVNAISLSRKEFEKKFGWDGRLFYRFGSADKSNVGRMETSGNFGKRVGFTMGRGIKYFNSISGGRDTGLQPKTGYMEFNVDSRFDIFLDNPDSKFVVAYQRTDQNNPWRAHKTIYGTSFSGATIGTDKERSFDQNRDLVYVQYHGDNLDTFFKNARASISYQLQQESQFRIRSDDRSDRQHFKVHSLGAFSYFTSPTVIGEMTYGFDYYHDFVESGRKNFAADGTLTSTSIQGPVADDSDYDLLGVFFQDELPILKKLSLIFGLRYTFAHAKAKKVEDPLTGGQISLSDSWHNVTESGRISYKPFKILNIYGGVSRGFRAPNLSDLTRLDSARTDEIETPSPGLEPETFTAYEVGVKLNYKHVRGGFSYWYTDVNDMIIRYPTGSVIDGESEVQKANIGEGYIQGVELTSDYNIHPEWIVFGGFSWQKGRVDTYPTSAQILERRPMSRIPPVTGITGIRWKHPQDKFFAEISLKLAGKQKSLSPSDEADTQRIPPGGTPGYRVLNLRGGAKITDYITVSATVENITNEDYRIHGSGQNEPGTNFIISLDWII